MSKAERERERSRHRNHARRVRMTGAYCERVEPLLLLEMDDGVCGICGEDVDPFDFHVDHIIPISRGGAHAYWNTQVAHPTCNVRKHTTHDGPLLPFVPLALRKQRALETALRVRDVLAEGLTYAQAAERLGTDRRDIQYRVRFLRERGIAVRTRPRGHRLDPSHNGQAPMPPRACLHCGASFTPVYASHRYCSRPCSWVAAGTGISFNKRDGRWVARVRVGGERKHVGYFDTEEEAASAAADFRRAHSTEFVEREQPRRGA